MKKILMIVIICVDMLMAQTSKEELLRVISRNDLKINKEKDVDICRIEYPDGKKTYKNLTNRTLENPTVNTTTINVWEIDTTLYQSMYTYWQDVPVSTLSAQQLVIADFNKNGRKEIYGYTKDYDDTFEASPVTIYELDSTGHFIYGFTYDDSVRHAQTSYDVKRNGNLNLFISSLEGNGLIYESNEIGKYPTNIDFVFYRYPDRRQMNNITFGDFDKNGKTDLLYFELFELKSYIFEFNSLLNNFVFVDTLPPYFASCAGYSIGDFDSDPKTDLVYGGIHGEVYVVEADSEHTYISAWMDTVDTYNAWMHMPTNDIDENGKPELWIGGAAFYDPNPPITRFTCFEAVGDNQYKEVHRIDIVGIFSFYAGNCFALDVDKDGTDELVICLDQHVFIFKFTGKSGKLAYKLLYAKRNNNPMGVYYGVTMNDLDNDGYEEMLIHQDNIREDGKGKHFTAIFKPNFLSSVEDQTEIVSEDYELQPSYPNPFNSSTIISFNIPKNSSVTIKVFDLLGNEVVALLDCDVNTGKHQVEWNGKDQFSNPVNSGVYFIQLITNSFQKTVKALLIK
ncbi:MAG: T9SS type A sorting domain-containing protein [Ignavibacteriaceae bacterium]|nr:T9SS type A sorting domain-containing protein [Ignavibacteriaceae bacterium]